VEIYDVRRWTIVAFTVLSHFWAENTHAPVTFAQGKRSRKFLFFFGFFVFELKARACNRQTDGRTGKIRNVAYYYGCIIMLDWRIRCRMYNVASMWSTISDRHGLPRRQKDYQYPANQQWKPYYSQGPPGSHALVCFYCLEWVHVTTEAIRIRRNQWLRQSLHQGKSHGQESTRDPLSANTGTVSSFGSSTSTLKAELFVPGSSLPHLWRLSALTNFLHRIPMYRANKLFVTNGRSDKLKSQSSQCLRRYSSAAEETYSK